MQVRRQLVALALAGYGRLLLEVAEKWGEGVLSPSETAAELEQLTAALQEGVRVIGSWAQEAAPEGLPPN